MSIQKLDRNHLVVRLVDAMRRAKRKKRGVSICITAQDFPVITAIKKQFRMSIPFVAADGGLRLQVQRTRRNQYTEAFLARRAEMGRG